MARVVDLSTYLLKWYFITTAKTVFGEYKQGVNLTSRASAWMVEATDDGKVISHLYTRLVPALVTLSIFLLGVLVICVNHWLKQKKSGMEFALYREVIADKDWLKRLRQQQKKVTTPNCNWSSTYLSNDRAKYKKYALYDNMLEKYKYSLKLQQQQALRKAENMADLQTTCNKDGGILKCDKKLIMRQPEKTESNHDRVSVKIDWLEEPDARAALQRLWEADIGLSTNNVQFRTKSSTNAKMKNEKGNENEIENTVKEQHSSYQDNTCDQDKAKKPRTRPKSCFVVFKGNAIIDEEFSRDKSKKLKRSISLFDKIKRSVGEEKYSCELDQEEEDAISKLFLKLKRIPTANMERNARPKSIYDNDDTSETSQSQIMVTSAVNVLDPNKTEKNKNKFQRIKDVNKSFKEVEQKMIQHLYTRHDLAVNEILALESLLEDVSRFCTEYNEEITEDGRQLSFSKANKELHEASKSSRNFTPTKRSANSSREVSFNERRDKCMSVYDTELLDVESVVVNKFTTL
ncbi:uncharacterized protein LOC130657250 isoform X2 [Hydractinia symbiolongicarpus]|uniref:uncharacterized protein LOC130657250 isoform X2 n=1 Tax=Hydractinia symbiolongicarpus TaxID=13093 RepID=UPI00254FF347|nr:uncharacterized protein LOC130657250 isoform X2 [Hydractinia symbiolongicarpus]